jgi:energy-converting hydrogenase Eha subunit C
MQMIINNDNCLDMMIVLNLPQPIHTNLVLFFLVPPYIIRLNAKRHFLDQTA